MKEVQGLLLGLANGTSCLTLCAPVLVPFLLSEGNTIRRNVVTLLEFLGGRLVGYLLFGLLAWVVGGLLASTGGSQALLIGGAYVGLSVLLLVAVFRKKPASGACPAAEAPVRLRRWPALIPAGMGLLAGLKVCPPMLLAFTDAAGTGTLGGSLLLFVTFFLGTSLYFLPLPLLGAFTRMPDLRIVGKFAAVIVALYYLVSGILLVAGGVKSWPTTL
ncbi:MAG: sulfite exporter TauE/SafE family protein [Spirochaetes bacterium]|nr:sulfite exporter TauE/SafE family protein [Spirochaetota bacterium]